MAWFRKAAPRDLSANQLWDLLSSRSGDIQLVDVREPDEYAEGHLPGAKPIPLGYLPARAQELDRQLPVILYCHSGNRSYAAGKRLIRLGFTDVAHLSPGLSGWPYKLEI
jgi:rhodanese-related sulfurtransferase